jgi:phosphatidylserine synthase
MALSSSSEELNSCTDWIDYVLSCSWRPMRYFKFKDCITTLNLFLSFYAVVLLFEDKFALASYIFFINVIILDLLDGYIARATKTANEFGKHLDSVTDFFGSSMIVPFFIYFALKDYNLYLALITAFLPLFTGVIREVRSRLEDISCPGFFVGFPRNSAALLFIAFFQTKMFTDWGYYWIAYLVILLVSLLQLSYLPFMGNDKAMLLKIPRIKYYLIICVALLIGFTYAGIFWEGVFLFMMCFVISPFVQVEKECRALIKKQIMQTQS